MAATKSVRTRAKKADSSDPYALSTANDPLQRLCENSLSLVRSTWTLLFNANWPATTTCGIPIGPDLQIAIPRFVARLQAVNAHQGEEWERLSRANADTVRLGEREARSCVELVADIAYEVYRRLFEAQYGRIETTELCVRELETGLQEVREIDYAKVEPKWQEVAKHLRPIPYFNFSKLELQIRKEFERASSRDIGEVPLTKLLRPCDIALAFGIHRNTVPKLLSKLPHKKVGSMIQMRLEDMPFEYRTDQAKLAAGQQRD